MINIVKDKWYVFIPLRGFHRLRINTLITLNYFIRKGIVDLEDIIINPTEKDIENR